MIRSIAASVLLVVLCLDSGLAQGQWETPFDLFNHALDPEGEIVHASLIPRGERKGEVIFWRVNWTCGTAGGCPCDEIPTYIWSPAAPSSAITAPGSVTHNIFCSGHAFMSDGNLLTAGGTDPRSQAQCDSFLVSFPNYSHVYDTEIADAVAGPPTLSPWSAAIPLQATCEPRYYPTILALPNAQQLLAGGGRSAFTDTYPTVPANCTPLPDWASTYELFDGTSWFGSSQALAGSAGCNSGIARTLYYYPLMHVVRWELEGQQPDWRVVIAHAGTHNLLDRNQEAYVLDPLSGSTASAGPCSAYTREYGSSVLLPKWSSTSDDRIMVLGGVEPKTCNAAWDNAEILTIHPDNMGPDLSWGMPMQMGPPGGPFPPRVFQNATIIADGKVLVNGGTREDYRDGCSNDLALEAMLYEPLTGVWTQVASQAAPRRYHSVSLLLRDGRVWTAGGQRRSVSPQPDDKDIEIYKPPYLFQGWQPEITFSDANAPYAPATFEVRVKVKIPNEVESVVLIKPGSTTHAFNTEQRFVALDFEVIAKTQFLPANGWEVWKLSVTGPAGDYDAPPGYYMLFALGGDGVVGDGIPCKLAEFVHVP